MSGQSSRASLLERSEPVERASLDELRASSKREPRLHPMAHLANHAMHHIKSQVRVTAKVRAVVPGSIERSQGKAKRVIDKRPR